METTAYTSATLDLKKRRLLLVSDGSLGLTSEFLQKIAPQATRVLFVPWAHKDWDAYAVATQSDFNGIGRIQVESIHEFDDPIQAVRKAEAIYVGGGNTFRLLKRMYETGVMPAIRERVAEGIPYIGTSAGCAVACITIKTTNDMPIVWPPSLDSLGLIPFNVNCHYYDGGGPPGHKGETRIRRLFEFHEENSNPVVGLKEGSMLWVEGDTITLRGEVGGKLFQQGMHPQELDAGEDLSFLLDSRAEKRRERKRDKGDSGGGQKGKGKGGRTGGRGRKGGRGRV